MHAQPWRVMRAWNLKDSVAEKKEARGEAIILLTEVQIAVHSVRARKGNVVAYDVASHERKPQRREQSPTQPRLQLSQVTTRSA